jgi:hypothetical protein
MGCNISSCINVDHGGITESSPPPKLCIFKRDKSVTTSAMTINENEIDLSHFTKPEKVIGLGGFG